MNNLNTVGGAIILRVEQLGAIEEQLVWLGLKKFCEVGGAEFRDVEQRPSVTLALSAIDLVAPANPGTCLWQPFDRGANVPCMCIFVNLPSLLLSPCFCSSLSLLFVFLPVTVLLNLAILRWSS